MKSNWLKYLALLGLVFVGNIFSMPQPKSRLEPEARKKAVRGMITKAPMQKKIIEPEVQSELKEWPPESGPEREKLRQAFMSDVELERLKKHREGYFFIYADDTSNGVYVQEKWLENNSEYIQNLIKRNNGIKPKEVGLPFSYQTIYVMFSLFEPANIKNLKLEDLTSEEWKDIVRVAQSLKMTPENMNIVLQYCPFYFIGFKNVAHAEMAVKKEMIENNCNIELLKEKGVMVGNEISISFKDPIILPEKMIKDVVQALNYDPSSELLKDFLQELSVYHFVALLNCIQYLEVKNKDIFIEEACDRIEKMGNKFMELISEIYLNESGRSIQQIKKDAPDDRFEVKIFDKIDRDLEKVILETVRSRKDNIIDRFILMPWKDQSEAILVEKVLESKHSIAGLLDVFYTRFTLAAREREKQEEAKKWFWQRKWFGRYGEKIADKIKWKLREWQWEFLGR